MNNEKITYFFKIEVTPKETQMQPKILCDRKIKQGWKNSSPRKDASL